ncbi:hypothetical protein P7C70_g7943, partial [Phenoliferia sp. Uapishka_3]
MGTSQKAKKAPAVAKDMTAGLPMSDRMRRDKEEKAKRNLRQRQRKAVQKGSQLSLMESTVNTVSALFVQFAVAADAVEVGRLAAMLVSAETTRDLFVGMVMYLQGGLDDPYLVSTDYVRSNPAAGNLYNLNHQQFYQRLIKSIFESDFHGRVETRNRVVAHLEMRQKKVKWYGKWKHVGEQAARCIFVHVMEPDSLEAQQAADGKKLWSSWDPSQPDTDWSSSSGHKPTFEKENDLVVHQYLKRRADLNIPHLHVIANAQCVAKDPSLDFLLKPGRNPLLRLTPPQAARFNVALTTCTNPSPHDPTLNGDALLDRADELGEFLLLARIDLESWRGWKKTSAQMRARTMVSAKYRKSWKRKGSKAAEGIAVGMGFRPDQRGDVGPYSNIEGKFRHIVLGESETLLLLQQEEATMCDFLLAVMGGALPGLLSFFQRTTQDANVAGAGISDVIITVAAMVAFDAPAHLEPPVDSTFTPAICIGAKNESLTPGGFADFVAPCVDNGLGVVVQSGPGTLIVWGGKKLMHGTGFARNPYHQQSIRYSPTSLLEPSQEEREAGEVYEAPTYNHQVLRLSGGADPPVGGRTCPADGRRVGTCAWQNRHLLKRAAKKVAKVVGDLNDAPIVEAEAGASFDLGGGVLPRHVIPV